MARGRKEYCGRSWYKQLFQGKRSTLCSNRFTGGAGGGSKMPCPAIFKPDSRAEIRWLSAAEGKQSGLHPVLASVLL